MHELATNATKYGALSNEDGIVNIRWRLEVGRVTLVWQELYGPSVQEPSTSGFGSKMIKRAFGADAAASVDLRFMPEGVVCEISFTPDVVQTQLEPALA